MIAAMNSPSIPWQPAIRRGLVRCRRVQIPNPNPNLAKTCGPTRCLSRCSDSPTPRSLHKGPVRALHTTTTTTSPPTSPPIHAPALVTGAGPGGIAAVGNLLSHLPRPSSSSNPLVWTDPTFTAGRVHARYRSVPSNTKVSLFVDFARATGAFRDVLGEDSGRKEERDEGEQNAVDRLLQLKQDEGCELGKAADVCLLLTERLLRRGDVRGERGLVQRARFVRAGDGLEGMWHVTIRTHGETTVTAQTPILVLCTGASPIDEPLPVVQRYFERKGDDSTTGGGMIPLDTALDPTLLAAHLSAPTTSRTPTVVAVIGASHSAILVLMNLVALARSRPGKLLQIRWFTRHRALRYAEQKDGWILRDNTGLKGAAAAWARTNLEVESEEAFATESPVGDVMVRKIWTGGKKGLGEENIYKEGLRGCTHVVQAVGYQRDEIPELWMGERELEVEFEPTTGRFVESGNLKREYVPGLFGAGIAFPERVTDPEGNVESAVGFWKFMRFLKRVVPEWVRNVEGK